MFPLSTHAEEGGSGHYMPGAAASFIDTLPGKSGLAIANFFNFYDASASVSKLGGLITAGLDATAYSDTVVALYQTPLKLLGGYYAVGAAIPFVWMKARGEAQLTGPLGQTITRTVRDTAGGIGDIMFYPFMLGWTGLNKDLKCDVRLGIYAPTGDYDKGKLANLGKNYWTFEPMVSLSYISSKIGLELSAFAGMDFNTENNKTDYRTGTQFHSTSRLLNICHSLVGSSVWGRTVSTTSRSAGTAAPVRPLVISRVVRSGSARCSPTPQKSGTRTFVQKSNGSRKSTRKTASKATTSGSSWAWYFNEQ